MRYKAILSDLDKTLIEDYLVPPKVIEVVKQFLRIPGEKAQKIVRDFYAIQTKKAHFLNGYSKVGAWKRVLQQNAVTYRPETIWELNHLFWVTAAIYARPYPGVIDAIKHLKKQGFFIGIVSGGDYITRYQHLEKTGILPLVDVLVTTEELGYVKDEKNIYGLAAHELGVSHEESITVGDHEVADIVLPQKEGFTTIRIAEGKIKSAADFIIPKFADIVKLLENEKYIPTRLSQP